MFFNIFHRLSRRERFIKKMERILRKIGKACNSDLISKLEEENDRGKVYFAIKGVFQDYISQRIPKSYEEARQIMQSVGAAQSIEGLKSISKRDPLPTFFFLLQIHARLLTEKDFRIFLRDSLEFLPGFTDMMIFKNPNLNLKFRSD